MKILSAICIFALLVGCVGNGYKQFYSPFVDTTTLTDIEVLAKGQEPQVFGTDDFDRDVRILRAKNYLLVGQSSFNGGYQDVRNAAEQAKAIGATVVLVSSEYTDTQTTTATLFLPDTQTTYHSGTVDANSRHSSPYGGYSGSSTTSGNYSGTSTTYGTKAVPITNTERRYDQHAIYLVKSTNKMRFGVYFLNLTPDQRQMLQRNTGVLLDVVVEDTPAFYANVLAGDFLIAVDGAQVRNVQHASELMRAVDPDAESSVLTVLRNGAEENIEVRF